MYRKACFKSFFNLLQMNQMNDRYRHGEGGDH